MISISIPNLPKFKKALAKYPEFAAVQIKDALYKSLIQIQNETKPITPVDTHRLRNSIGGQGSADGIFKIEKNIGTIGTNVEYAIYVEEGNQMHKIGQSHFLETGAKKSLPAIKGFFEDALNNVFNNIAKESK